MNIFDRLVEAYYDCRFKLEDSYYAIRYKITDIIDGVRDASESIVPEKDIEFSAPIKKKKTRSKKKKKK